VDELHDIDREHHDSFMMSEADKQTIQDKIMYLRVMGTSALELDTNVMHPFVRIHILNMTTGCYV